MTKILIIEDTKSVLESIKLILKLENYEVLEASNGKEGIESAINYLPDLIICDIMMPLLNGYDVLETLRQDNLTSSIPFIFLTAKATNEDFRKGMALGADDYIAKPFTSEEIVSAVKTRIKKFELVKKNGVLFNENRLTKLEHFKNDLKVHGLDIIVNLQSEYKDLLEVLYKIITYPVHEGEPPFLGVLFKKDNITFSEAILKLIEPDDIETAYKLSDSSQCFVLYNEKNFSGLIVFKEKMSNEKAIIDILGDTDVVLITSNKGIKKVYFKENIFTNDATKWKCKYPISFYISQINKKYLLVNETIISLLNFAFYSLSPNYIGATIVYDFKSVQKENKINNINKYFNVNSKTDLIPIKNIIYTTDGAVFIDYEGNFIDYGIHLSSSEQSKTDIPINHDKGTRHNSAQRYSYDNKNCLVITVSKDGHVTIYSNGSNICYLE